MKKARNERFNKLRYMCFICVIAFELICLLVCGMSSAVIVVSATVVVVVVVVVFFCFPSSSFVDRYSNQ